MPVCQKASRVHNYFATEGTNCHHLFYQCRAAGAGPVSAGDEESTGIKRENEIGGRADHASSAETGHLEKEKQVKTPLPMPQTVVTPVREDSMEGHMS